MAPLSRGGIPVPPREHRRGSQSGRGAGNAAGHGGGQARRPSIRDGATAPWRSSLDLVWSYSRSQAFYGDNFATSPSFADRHWAGPSNAIDSSVEETSEGEEEEETDEYDYEEDTEDEYADDVDHRRRDDDIVTASPAAGMEWNDEQLPPNAVPRRDSQGLLGRRERRDLRERSPGRRGLGGSGGSRTKHQIDRNIRRITDEDDDEERSRSRSRSPKRVNLSRPSASHLRDVSSSSYEEAPPHANARQQRGTTGGASIPILRSIRSSLAGGKRDGGARKVSVQSPTSPSSENTPLLRHRSSVGDDTLEAGTPHSRRPSILHTPSWFRNSNVSTTSSKFRMQGYGTSTFWQSWFNTVNALVGVGILALPLAISYAGLIPGILLFLLCGLVTNYTGKVLAHIMAAEPSLRTYADVGNFAFGAQARLLVGFFFCLELWAVSTALVILFGDSLRALLIAAAHEGHPSAIIVRMAEWSPAAFKALGMVIVLPTMFLPLRLLSPVSVVGIVSVVTLFAVVLSDGLIKKHAPGSLIEPIKPDLGPQWMRLPLSFGLIMSGFSSHPIIPSLFKDMRNPRQFCRMLNWAYVAATIIYLGMGLIGYLMFGRGVSDEITRDLAHTDGYPRVLNKVAIWLIVINPLSKFALAARPVVTTVELLLGVEESQMRAAQDGNNLSTATHIQKTYAAIENGEPHTTANGGGGYGSVDPSTSAISLPPNAMEDDDNVHATSRGGGGGVENSPLVGSTISLRAAQRTARWSPKSKVAVRVTVQVIVTFLIGLTAVLLPGFERVMAFLGAFLACTTCIFGPLLAKLRLFRHEMSRARIAADVGILIISLIVAALGTVWSFLPVANTVRA